MSELALKLIAENKETKAKTLDLKHSNLAKLPDELFECIWIESIDLSFNDRLSSLDQISSLTNLQHLSFCETQVSDLAPISKLTQLKVLDCSYTDIVDLSAITNLKNLQRVYFYETAVSDLLPISYLTDLRVLSFSGTKVFDIQPVSQLNNLEIIAFIDTKVSDLSPVDNLKKLHSLSFDNTKVLDLSPIVNLTNLQTLSCSNTQVSDLTPITNLVNLKNLSCNSTHVSDLSPVANLLNLQTLLCSNTQVSDLNPIMNLVNLQTLSCHDTHVSDLSPIANLLNLQTLSCSNTQVSDLSPIANLVDLQTLSCSNTEVSDLSPITNLVNLRNIYFKNSPISYLAPITYLTNLNRIDFSFSNVSDLAPITNLINLKHLDCDWTEISNLTPVSKLSNLLELHCSYTQISDLGPVVNLSQLQKLTIGNTPISDLTPLRGLNKLRRLDCWSTLVSDLSPILHLVKGRITLKWLSLGNTSGIYFENCPLIIPPIEFAQAGNEAILEYFDQLGEDRTPLNEIKVIFLGEGAAGKTSLVKRIRNEDFDAKESQTHGIRIRKTPFEVEGETIQAHIWDFGGQEVMHATHQFFLSQRCVYVLVLNSRTDEKAEYWLKHASSFGGKSPVLVVLNKMDENPGYDVNRKQLLEKYPQIVDFFKVSCKENKGIDDFKAALTNQIARSDTRRTPFPKAWSAVKAHFADMKEDYIESDVYRRVCEEKGVEKAFSQEVLLQFLHDLGVVINFRNLKNFDTQILNPLWLTNGVYRVINSQIVADKQGLLHEDDFDAVINDKRYTEKNTTDKTFHYPKNKLEYIVRVMEVFELCSRLDAHTYVIPQLLPVDEPDFKFEGAVLHFVLRFPEFLPDSVFPRLMVKLNPYVKDNLRWRTGMVLYKPAIFNAQARIRADKEDKEIRIDLCGAEPRRFLSFIRETIREIAADFAKLDYDEMVPVPETAEFMEYQYLIEAEKAGEKEIFVRGKGRIPISNLLNGVEEAVMRSEEGQMPVKVFVSYSHQDLDHLKDLRSALSPLQRLGKLKIWDDRDINAGVEWEKEIFRELAEADIVLCLISMDFINSNFCFSKELAMALAAHAVGNQKVIPVRVRKCAWEGLDIAGLQGTPTSEWITLSKNKDEAWTEVAHHLTPVVDEIKARKVLALKSKGH